MSKFWGAAGILTLIGIALILLGNQSTSGINFTDFETECRYDRGEFTDITVSPDNQRLSFEGHFPINNTKSDLKYNYRVSGDEIILNILPEQRERPGQYIHTCLGLVVYNAQTERIPDGRYRVEVQHDGERVEEKVIVFG
jgi:hypothetical protein